MADSLDKAWSRLSLEADEIAPIDPEADSVAFDKAKSLVGKVLCLQTIGHRDIANRMREVWRPKGAMKDYALDDNPVIFEFQDIVDKKRILGRAPWTMGSHPLLLEDASETLVASRIEMSAYPLWVQLHDLPIGLMTVNFARQIGNNLGEFADVECNMDGSPLGRFLRLKTRIDIRKPLRRIITVSYKGESYVVKLKYERLPDFCYCCGLLGHLVKDCIKALDHSPGKPMEYGAFLKADLASNPFPRSRPTGRTIWKFNGTEPSQSTEEEKIPKALLGGSNDGKKPPRSKTPPTIDSNVGDSRPSFSQPLELSTTAIAPTTLTMNQNYQTPPSSPPQTTIHLNVHQKFLNLTHIQSPPVSLSLSISFPEPNLTNQPEPTSSYHALIPSSQAKVQPAISSLLPGSPFLTTVPVQFATMEKRPPKRVIKKRGGKTLPESLQTETVNSGAKRKLLLDENDENMTEVCSATITSKKLCISDLEGLEDEEMTSDLPHEADVVHTTESPSAGVGAESQPCRER